MTAHGSSDLVWLERLEAMRRLARSLVADRDLAEDVVQDAMLAAIERPASDVPRGGWLRAVLRNALRQRLRGDRRRHERHAVRPAPENVPSAADAAAELAEHRHVLLLVQELAEAQRQAVFLHFWRGLSAREIGAQLGIPAKTVHARIERGLARLRERLDDRPGGRVAWVVTLAAFADAGAARPPIGPAELATTTSTLLLMKSKLLVAAALTAAALVLWSQGTFDVPGPVPIADPAAVQVLESGAGPLAAAAEDRGPAAGTRELVAAAPAVPEAGSAVSPTVVGYVIDLAGRPLAGAPVAFRRLRSDRSLAAANARLATSDGAGAFTLELPDGEGCLDVLGEDFVAVLRPWLHGVVPEEPPLVVVGPRRRAEGVVVDPEGQPVAGARVEVTGPDRDFIATQAVGGRVVAFPSDLGVTETDDRGVFVFERVAYVEGAAIVASREPFAVARTALPAADVADLRLQLGAAGEEGLLYGVVLSAERVPAADVLVAVGGESVRTDIDGRFAVPWAWGQRPTLLRAVHERLGVAFHRLAVDASGPGAHRDEPVVVRLSGTTGVVRGRVLDAAGQPAVGVTVWTPDLTFFGSVTRDEKGQQISGGCTIEGLADDGRPRWSLETETDADGGFALRGLLERDYAVFAMDPRSLVAAGPVIARPGDDLVVDLPAPALRAIRGRALSRAGEPLAGVKVALGRRFDWRPPARDPDPWSDCAMTHMGAGQLFRDRFVLTDADGRFDLRDVAVDGSYLWFEGDALFLAPRRELDPAEDLAALEVRLPARSTFRVELLQPGEADGLRLERDGGPTPVFMRLEGLVMSVGQIDLVDGRSPPVYTAAGPVTALLLAGEEVVRRVDAVLPAGVGHTVRL